ncbi:MAG: hypothetical protein LQ346_006502 [Caloplaca aetnensis]|nr:MAG: hypothetical protein LQ346_006502 [Caloplaca aetnensis]
MAPRKVTPKQKKAPAKSTNGVKKGTAASRESASPLLPKSTRRGTRSTGPIRDENILRELTPVPTTAQIINGRRFLDVGQTSGAGQFPDIGQLSDAGQLPDAGQVPNAVPESDAVPKLTWIRGLYYAIIRALRFAMRTPNVAASTIQRLRKSRRKLKEGIRGQISPSALGATVIGLLFLVEQQDKWIVQAQLREFMLTAGNRGC